MPLITIKVLDWDIVKGVIGVDRNNPNSKVAKDGTIINPRTFDIINVVVEIQGQRETFQIEAPYDRNKLIAKIKPYLESKFTKTDVGASFEVNI